jgi:hypothetical protein
MALTKITTGLIAANTLATANIADNSVDATKIAANSILTRHIDDDQVTGDQLADNITIAGNLVVSGNLTTNGSSVTNSSSNTTIEDNIIELGTGTSGSPSSDSGIVIERGSSNNAFMGWDESADKFIVGTGTFTGASSGNLTITAAPLVTGALTASGLSFPTSDGTSGQVLRTDGSGALSFADNTTKVDNYTATGNGSTTAFDTGTNPGNEVNTWIFVDGVYQQKSQYSYSGSTVTFSTAPENGALIDVITGTSSNITASDTVLGVYEATTSNTDAYSTGISAANENNTWVFVGGVYQPKDSYTFSSGTLTFDANTPTGQKLSVVATKTLTAGTVDTASLAANAISSAKIASNAILSRHIVNNSIVGADISATTQITANTFTGALTGNVTGNVAGNLTGTILTAAQTNITSVGTLSAATVSGQLTAGGLAYPTSDGSNEQVLKTDGSGTISFGTVSGTTINNNTNNYVMTGTGSSNTLNGESSLQFDGTNLTLASGDLLYTGGGNFDIKNTIASQNITFHTRASGGSTAEKMRITHDGHVFIENNSGRFKSGAAGNLQMYNDGTNSYITASGGILNLTNNDIRFKASSGETMLRAVANGAVELMHNNSTRIATNSTGVTVTGSNSVDGYIGQFTQANTSNGDGVLINIGSAAASEYALTVRSNAGNTSVLACKGDGKVGIGTFSPSVKLHVEGAGNQLVLLNNSSTNDGLYLKAGTGESAIQTNGGSHLINFYTSGNARMRIHSNGVVSASEGIALGAGLGNTAANVIDDYEEGTWTPALSGITTNSSTMYGIYTKIGRICHIHAKISVTVASLPGATFVITGLPFTSKDASDAGQRAIIAVGGDMTNVGGNGHKLQFRTNGTNLQGVWINSGSTAYFTYNLMDHTVFEISIHGHYTV